MIYPENTVDKLGFTEIKAGVSAFCLSADARELAARMQPQTRFERIELFLRQTHEFKEALGSDTAPPLEAVFPLKPLAVKARLEGVFLSETEFHELRLGLRTVFGLLIYFKERPGLYPALETLLVDLVPEKGMLVAIERIIDEKGQIRSHASKLLAELSEAIARAEKEAHRRIEQVFKHAQSQGWTADGNLTVRDGRLCIPVLAEHKRRIKGFVHDESASGQTAYIEPEEVFHLNNRVRDLEFDWRRETIRILTELTDQIRPFVPVLLDYHEMLTKVDFIRAKALFARDIDAHLPELVREPILALINAEHPLLKLNFRQKGGLVVPLNIKMDAEDRMIVVSGPNAGGKSVCLKTVGLLQLMAQSGLLIPADPRSKVGVFKSFFSDIGDSQSIESDLSTYSAHLTRMKYFTEHADARTLLLIDEFGTGTDPLFGGPMAEAVLEALNQKQAKGVVTTHYSNLKIFAGHTPGLQNASMLFDHEAMRPLYVLQIGKPGSSYAFEIAQKIGLDHTILEVARQKVGKQQKHVDTLLVDLEREKGEILTTRRELEKKEAQLNRLKQENAQLQEYLESNKNAILKKAKADAKELIRQANKLIENTISEIRANEADKERTRVLRQKLREEASKFDSPPPATARRSKSEGGKKPGTAGSASRGAITSSTDEPKLQVGDWVRIRGTGTEAQIIEIAKNNLILAMGELRTVQKVRQVERLDKRETARMVKATRRSNQVTRDMSQFSPEIDVRGMRTEAALYEIEKVLDQAIMLGYPNLRIVHGKGDGILRRFIREYLRKYSQVTRLEDEHPDRGGDGVTYAHLA